MMLYQPGDALFGIRTSMIRKSGIRFSDKIMLKQKVRAHPGSLL